MFSISPAHGTLRQAAHPVTSMPAIYHVILERDQRKRLRANNILGTKDEERFPEVLVHRLLLDQTTPLDQCGFVYLWNYEYDIVPGYSNHGIGDFLFTNKTGDSLAVVECKALTDATGKTARTSRNKDRKKLRKQACTYWQQNSKIYPTKHVSCWIFWKELSVFKYTVLAETSAREGVCVCGWHN